MHLVRTLLPLLALGLIDTNASADANAPMQVSSPAFASHGSIPALFSCDGEGTSPPLQWTNVPPRTKSLAVVVDDPDAPRGTFVHWVMYGIAPSTTRLPTGAAQAMSPGAAIQGRNSKNDTGFAPFCPPSGTHHYRFRVYALDDTPVALDKATSTDLAHAMRGHVLASGELVATYTRGSR
jgi:hypothetical protein